MHEEGPFFKKAEIMPNGGDVNLLEQGLAKYKCPERIEAITSFPITRVGKLDRQQMRQWIAVQLTSEIQEAADRA